MTENKKTQNQVPQFENLRKLGGFLSANGLSAMKENIIKRCLCTKIYVQGVTFSDVRILVNLEGGGNNTSAIQKPGRLAEIRPNKKCGIVIDLLFVPPGNEWGDYAGEEWLALCRDSKARKTAYEEKGYNITIVNNVQQLKEKFDELI